MAALARIPLLRQPGEAWLYNTCSDILGVLIARVSGRRLPEFLAERLFGPLGMADTGFEVPASKLDRFTSYYRTGPAGALELVDAPGGQWSSLPAFPSGAGGLVSTVDDWHRFARMLLAGGSAGGRQLLSAASVQQMTTDQLTPSQRDASRLFLEGQGWGFGGSVDVEAIDPWNVTGRYGWVGGTRNGSARHCLHRRGRHLAEPAGTGRPDPARPDAGVLAARGDHLKPGRVRPAAPPLSVMKSQSRWPHATSGNPPAHDRNVRIAEAGHQAHSVSRILRPLTSRSPNLCRVYPACWPLLSGTEWPVLIVGRPGIRQLIGRISGVADICQRGHFPIVNAAPLPAGTACRARPRRGRRVGQRSPDRGVACPGSGCAWTRCCRRGCPAWR
jgi:hypothetical protein